MTDNTQKVTISRAADADYQDIGRYDAKILRTGPGQGDRHIPRHLHKLDIQFIYVVKGWVRIWFDGTGEVTLTAGDRYVSPADVAHDVQDWSDDHEVLELTSPAEFETVEVGA